MDGTMDVMGGKLDSLFLAIVIFSALFFLLQLAGFVRSRSRAPGSKRDRERDRERDRDARRRGVRRVAVTGAVAGALLAVYLVYLYPWPSPYAFKLDAVRALDGEMEPVDLSFWCYDRHGDLIKRVFTPGKLVPETQARAWIGLDDPEYTTISASALSADDAFECRIVLNPNRLVTPPDAVFTGALQMPQDRAVPDDPHTYVIKSDGEGLLELRVLAIRR